MSIERYDAVESESHDVFEFESVGRKGVVKKLVKYSQIAKGIYNLGFGDVDIETGDVSDKVVTDNGDMEKVLATVAYTVYRFYETHPDARVYITGSTPSRIRLYRTLIGKHLLAIQEDFDVFAVTKRKLERYKKGMDFDGVLIRRKRTNFE